MTSPQTSPVLVVTGAGSGIGRATALHLAATRPERLVLIGRRTDPLAETAALVRAASPEADPLPLPCDLSDPDAAERALAVSELAQVAGLALVAGGLAPDSPADGRSEWVALAEDWAANWRLNVLTAVLPVAMLRNRLAPDSRIVALGSIAEVRGGGSYGSAKAALVPWMRDQAKSLGAQGITMNLVAPGYIAETEFFGDAMTSERHDRLVAETLNGRAGTVEDVAATIGHLLSPEAGHITGQVLHVNGGALLVG